MHEAVGKILAEIRPKIKALLRTRKHYDTESLISQFKTHIWSIMEQHNGAIFHAASSVLHKLDSVQKKFLDELDVSESAAFLKYNFSPPKALAAVAGETENHEKNGQVKIDRVSLLFRLVLSSSVLSLCPFSVLGFVCVLVLVSFVVLVLVFVSCVLFFCPSSSSLSSSLSFVLRVCVRVCLL